MAVQLTCQLHWLLQGEIWKILEFSVLRGWLSLAVAAIISTAFLSTPYFASAFALLDKGRQLQTCVAIRAFFPCLPSLVSSTRWRAVLLYPLSGGFYPRIAMISFCKFIGLSLHLHWCIVGKRNHLMSSAVPDTDNHYDSPIFTCLANQKICLFFESVNVMNFSFPKFCLKWNSIRICLSKQNWRA